MYDILEIIDKKEKGLELTKSEIEFAVMGYVNTWLSNEFSFNGY